MIRNERGAQLRRTTLSIHFYRKKNHNKRLTLSRIEHYTTNSPKNVYVVFNEHCSFPQQSMKYGGQVHLRRNENIIS